MKVIVFGCQQIAVDFLDYLNKNEDIDVPLVVTYELPLDITYGYESVLRYCDEVGIDVMAPERLDIFSIEKIRKIKPDIIFSIYYRKVFPQALIDIPKLGCINIHPSLLPEYRGPTPTAWAILNGERYSGVTIHYMDKEIDTGDILVQKRFEIGEYETGYELYTRAMTIGGNLLKRNFSSIVTRKIKAKRQVGVGSYFGKIDARYFINWKSRTDHVVNQIRVRSKPYSPAESILFNRYFFFHRVRKFSSVDYVAQRPGRIVDIDKDGKIIISCADGCIRADDYDVFPPLTGKEKKTYLRIGNVFEQL